MYAFKNNRVVCRGNKGVDGVAVCATIYFGSHVFFPVNFFLFFAVVLPFHSFLYFVLAAVIAAASVACVMFSRGSMLICLLFVRLRKLDACVAPPFAHGRGRN